MGRQRFFEIPNDRDAMVRLLEAIPSRWSQVNGELHAPHVLVDLGHVQQDTGWVIDQFHALHPRMVGRRRSKGIPYDKPNVYAITVEQKLAGFVYFDGAGQGAAGNAVTVQEVKELAVGFVKQGFRGDLQFLLLASGWKYEMKAQCELHLESWRGTSCFQEEVGEQPAHLKVAWDERWDGKEEDILSILETCHELNLREFTPIRS